MFSIKKKIYKCINVYKCIFPILIKDEKRLFISLLQL